MKEKFIHVCFVVDESGSMSGSENDIIGGFKKIIDEQKAIEGGECAVSLYKFANKVERIYRGRDVREVEYLDEKSYRPGGCTAMNDAIGTAIDEIGQWLDSMDESQKPEKNLIVIMTDGEENSSTEYSLTKVKEMIKHQEDKYNWTFLYLGADINDASDAKLYGFDNRLFSTKKSLSNTYDLVNLSLSSYRLSEATSAEARYADFTTTLDCSIAAANADYEVETGNKIANND